MPLATQALRWLIPWSAMRLCTTIRDAPGSELSVNDVLQGVVHQRQVGVHALELGVLVCSSRSCARCDTVMPANWLFHL
jgi:hypothetical protein